MNVEQEGIIKCREVGRQALEERPNRFTVEYGERVMQFEVLGPQRWARLRKRIIRIFHLKRMTWCLEAYLYPGGGRYEWVRVANPQSGLRMSRY
jgi:hypothetical protein